MNKFSAKSISFSESKQFSKLFVDYVSNKKELSSFYAFPTTNEGYKLAASKLMYDEKNRSVLVEVIRDQYKKTGIDINNKLIDELALPGSMAVCTGHQLCLFTGPLYFIYKIISTIRLAEVQSNLLGKKIIPIYWMASEDHDFEEIRSVNVFGKKLIWETNAKGAVGDLRTDSLTSMLSDIKNLLGDSANAIQLNKILEEAYRPGRSLAEATRSFVNTLFNGSILILDANDSRLKKIFAPTMKREVEKKEAESLVNISIKDLEKIGYSAQVNPRNINLFYMKENLRERIEEVDGKYKVLNTDISFTLEALFSEIDSHPENFSPNVVLRPIYQQTILPNLAYVGGPGEISYWLEYKTMFDEFKVTFPILQPRHFALLLDKNSNERLSKFEISVTELLGDVEELIKSFVKKNSGDTTSLDSEKEGLKKIFEVVREKIIPIDPTLNGTVDAELQKQINALENLEAKVMRAAKQKQETAINQIRKLREKILPGGILQERFENFMPYYLKHGASFVEDISQNYSWPIEGLLILNEE